MAILTFQENPITKFADIIDVIVRDDDRVRIFTDMGVYRAEMFNHILYAEGGYLSLDDVGLPSPNRINAEMGIDARFGHGEFMSRCGFDKIPPDVIFPSGVLRFFAGKTRVLMRVAPR